MYNKIMNKVNNRKFRNKYSRYIAIVSILVFVLIKIFQQDFFGQDTQNDFNEVSLVSCIDGDTATLNVSGSTQKVRFIAVDTPEITSNDYYAKEAKNYVCDRLNQGPIFLEFDPNSDQYDDYGRMIAWVYVGDSLLQKEIIEEGYGKVKYIYGDYKYVDELNQLQSQAKKSKMGIWR